MKSKLKIAFLTLLIFHKLEIKPIQQNNKPLGNCAPIPVIGFCLATAIITMNIIEAKRELNSIEAKRELNSIYAKGQVKPNNSPYRKNAQFKKEEVSNEYALGQSSGEYFCGTISHTAGEYYLFRDHQMRSRKYTKGFRDGCKQRCESMNPPHSGYWCQPYRKTKSTGKKNGYKKPQR